MNNTLSPDIMKVVTAADRELNPMKSILIDNGWSQRQVHTDKKVKITQLYFGLNESQWKSCTTMFHSYLVKEIDAIVDKAYMSMIRLDLGCGNRTKAGYIGIDQLGKADILMDVTKEPLPFADSTVDAIYSDHFLEHLAIEDIVNLMGEIHRVCKPDALVEIRVPHFSGFTNFYEFHKTSFRLNSFAEYMWEEGMFNSNARISLISRKINLVNRQSPKNHAVTKWFWWNHPMEWLVNKFPRAYEMSGWRNIFPAWEIIFKFRVMK